MAAYFEFDKRHPHIKYDDVYVKNGKVENNKLILNYSVDGLKPLEVDLSSIANLIEVDSELSSTSMNPVTNAATVAGIETAKKEAIDFADIEFSKLKLYKGEPTECAFPSGLKQEGRSATFGNGVYALGKITKTKDLTDGKVCYILKSTDGINFEPIILETDTINQSRFNFLEFDPVSKMFYGGRDRLFRSADLVTWELMDGFPKNNIKSMSFIDGQIFIGTEYNPGESSVANLWRSTDSGVTWEIYHEGSFGHIAINGDNIVIAKCYDQSGFGGIKVSHDGGKTWTSPVGFENIGSGCGGLIFFKGNFIVQITDTVPNGGGIYWSPDGEVWTKCTDKNVNGIIYSYHAFIKSPDGRYLCFCPCYTFPDYDKTNVISLTVDGKTWHPVAKTAGYKSWQCVWGDNGIIMSGKESLQPTLLKNIEVDYKVNLIGDVLMNAPTFTETSTIGQIADFLNALAKPFKVS